MGFTTQSPTTKSLKFPELFCSPSSLPSTSPRRFEQASDGSSLDLDLFSRFESLTTQETSSSILLDSSPLMPRILPTCKLRNFRMDVLPCSLPLECVSRSRSTERESLRTWDFNSIKEFCN